jgi:transcriptional regulator with XRE-family HTH domain
MEVGMKHDVVAFLLDESVPAERLGEVLRAARKRRGWKRREAAKHTGIDADRLRDYERGHRAVPADICLQLAECYGDDLTAHVPLRVPPRITERSIAVDEQSRVLRTGTTEEILTGYVEIVARLRRARPGTPVALRVSDIAALSAVLDCEPSRIEQRIVELLECTREEARALHDELLRRKVILPVAGLAAGVVALTGFTTARADTGSPSPSPTTAATTTSTVLGAAPAVPSTTAFAPTTTVAPTTTTAAPATPAVDEPDVPVTDATVPLEELAAELTPPLEPPVVDPNDTTPMSIPAGEKVVIIGTPASTSEPTTPIEPEIGS